MRREEKSSASRESCERGECKTRKEVERREKREAAEMTQRHERGDGKSKRRFHFVFPEEDR